MAVACSTSAFKMPLGEALKTIAGLGFSDVDLICIPGFGHIIPAELAADFDAYAGRVEAQLGEAGLTPVAMNSAVANPYQRDDGEKNAQRLREVEAVAKLAERLDVGVVSFFPGGNWPAQEMEWDDVLAAEVETLKEMLAIGEKHGVTVAVEPHYNTPFQTLEQGTRLLEAMPELKVAYDPSHYAMQEIDLRETGAILERAAHVHLRDAAPGKMQELFGKGTVDFGWILGVLSERGYEGRFSIEYLPGLPGDVGEEIVKLKDKLEELLG